MASKMKVEVWSDIMCPFCYIGKRNYESALKQFHGRNNIKLVWKSFQLNPLLSNKPPFLSTIDYLKEYKGIPESQARNMFKRIIDMGKSLGIDFNFDKTIISNTFDGHRLMHLARNKDLDDHISEELFIAHFVEGKNISDFETLIDIGKKVGLDESEVREMLNSDKYKDEVKKEIDNAYSMGITGVPYFVFNGKFAISGAREPEVFLQALEKSFSEWKNENTGSTTAETIEGSTCNIDGVCK